MSVSQTSVDLLSRLGRNGLDTSALTQLSSTKSELDFERVLAQQSDRKPASAEQVDPGSKSKSAARSNREQQADKNNEVEQSRKDKSEASQKQEKEEPVPSKDEGEKDEVSDSGPGKKSGGSKSESENSESENSESENSESETSESETSEPESAEPENSESVEGGETSSEVDGDGLSSDAYNSLAGEQPTVPPLEENIAPLAGEAAREDEVAVSPTLLDGSVTDSTAEQGLPLEDLERPDSVPGPVVEGREAVVDVEGAQVGVQVPLTEEAALLAGIPPGGESASGASGNDSVVELTTGAMAKEGAGTAVADALSTNVSAVGKEPKDQGGAAGTALPEAVPLVPGQIIAGQAKPLASANKPEQTSANGVIKTALPTALPESVSVDGIEGLNTDETRARGLGELKGLQSEGATDNKAQGEPRILSPAGRSMANAALAGNGQSGTADLTAQVASLKEAAAGTSSSTSIEGPRVAVAPMSQFQTVAAKGANVQTLIQTPVGQPQWGTAVANKVLWMAAQNLTSAEIHLDPPELGQLMVKITVSQDQASVSFNSPHAAVREALDQNAFRLREQFEDQGMDLVDVNVGEQAHSQQGEGGETGQGSGSGPGGGEEPAQENSLPVAKVVGLVDYFV